MGLIGTVHFDDGKMLEDASATTPSPEILHEMFGRMLAHRVSHCVMEVSSHALDQGRTSGLHFSSAVFTNLTQDHLDYHHDLETYYQTKRKLFVDSPTPERIIINRSDPYGVRLIDEIGSEKGVVCYGLDPRCDYFATDIQSDLSGLSFTVVHHEKRFSIHSRLVFKHNVFNLLASIASGHEEGMDFEEIASQLIHFPGVPGRMERIDEGQDFSVFVDYAHTPDAILNVLSAAQTMLKNRVIVVFGCGGNRDKLKRPMMGKIANCLSDLVILTSDNPRDEDPMVILDQIRSGIDSSAKPGFTRCSITSEINSTLNFLSDKPSLL